MLNGDAHQLGVEELRIRPVALSKTGERIPKWASRTKGF
jgi:hypothetical protein